MTCALLWVVWAQDDASERNRSPPARRKDFPATINQAAKLAADEVASRSRQEYRRDVVIGFVKSALEEALENQPDIDVTFEELGETENV